MKILPFLCVVATLHTLTFSTLAASDVERELKQAQDQREKALAAAAEPINRRYLAILEQLLRRATQSNELETAVSIKEQIKSLSVSAPVGSGNSLKQVLTEGTWGFRHSGTFEGAPDVKVTLKPGGEALSEPAVHWIARWDVAGPRQFKLLQPEAGKYWAVYSRCER